MRSVRSRRLRPGPTRHRRPCWIGLSEFSRSFVSSKCHADRNMKTTVLTTEEEGIGLLCGAWLGGERGALLMQSSGVGNCINTLSLAIACGFPMLMLVTMRGEWGEFNPWQVPMGQIASPTLRRSGTVVYELTMPDWAAATVEAAGRI